MTTSDRAEVERRWRHDVGMASRVLLHRELAADHETCPYCGEDLVWARRRRVDR